MERERKGKRKLLRWVWVSVGESVGEKRERSIIFLRSFFRENRERKREEPSSSLLFCWIFAISISFFCLFVYLLAESAFAILEFFLMKRASRLKVILARFSLDFDKFLHGFWGFRSVQGISVVLCCKFLGFLGNAGHLMRRIREFLYGDYLVALDFIWFCDRL